MGFIYIIIIPVVIHVKCVYFDLASGEILDEPEHNCVIKRHRCECDLVYKSRWTQWL